MLVKGKYLVCSEACDEEKKDINSWNDLKQLALEWSGHEPYGDIYEKVDWASGPRGNYLHKLCRLKLVSPKIV